VIAEQAELLVSGTPLFVRKYTPAQKTDEDCVIKRWLSFISMLYYTKYMQSYCFGAEDNLYLATVIEIL